MKKFFLLSVFIVSAFISRADFMDFVDIYKNGELIWSMNTSYGPPPEIAVSLGDTLIFKARTDWDLLFKATLDINDAAGAVDTTLYRIPNNSPGADFMLIVDERVIEQTLNFRLNYNTKTEMEPFDFALIKLARKE